MWAIRVLVDDIAEKFYPEKIILFGSHAYGNPQPWSDVDLLVVMEGEQHPIEMSQTILRALPPFMFSVDIVVRSSETIQRRIELGDWFLKEIADRGKVLYERVSNTSR